jgi:uncharacterized membrane protein
MSGEIATGCGSAFEAAFLELLARPARAGIVAAGLAGGSYVGGHGRVVMVGAMRAVHVTMMMAVVVVIVIAIRAMNVPRGSGWSAIGGIGRHCGAPGG